MKTIYDFSVKDADLKDVSLENYKEKILLIVNVASYCGLTYQYEGIESLYKKYKDKGFEVLAFPIFLPTPKPLEFISVTILPSEEASYFIPGLKALRYAIKSLSLYPKRWNAS